MRPRNQVVRQHVPRAGVDDEIGGRKGSVALKDLIAFHLRVRTSRRMNYRLRKGQTVSNERGNASNESKQVEFGGKLKSRRDFKLSNSKGPITASLRVRTPRPMITFDVCAYGTEGTRNWRECDGDDSSVRRWVEIEVKRVDIEGRPGTVPLGAKE